MQSTSYKILFTINLLNDYHTDTRCTDFDFVPSTETAALIKRLQLVVKVIDNGLFILAKTSTDGKLTSAIDSSKKFVFYLRLNNTQFTSFTNIDTDALPGKKFYFTNLNRNGLAGTADTVKQLYLSSKIDAYNQSQTYHPGDFADNGKGALYECLQTTTGNKVTNNSFWLVRNNQQFVSSKDLIKPVTAIFNQPLAKAATDFDITVSAFDTAANSFTKVVQTQKLQFDKPVQNIRLNLSALPAAQYLVKVNKEQFFVYADNQLMQGGYFGAIEIYPLPDGDDFAFTDKDGLLKEVAYTIHFANRRAFWKYIVTRQGVKSIVDKNNNYTFTAASADANEHAAYFTSDVPIPLNEKSLSFRIKLLKALSCEDPVAANPNLSLPGSLIKTENGFYCNVYLNY